MTIIAMMVLFGIFLAMGMPVIYTMAASAFITLVFFTNVPLAIMVQQMLAGIDSFPLLAIPFFVFAGGLMTGGALTRQLVRITVAYFKGFPAGTGTVDIGASMLFAGVSGSGTADMAAIGSVLIPRLIQRGYPRGLAAALEAAAGAIGPIIPPSMLMILYAGMAEVSVGRMFLGGIVPGTVVGVGLAIALQLMNRIHKWEPREPYGPAGAALKEIFLATIFGIPALMVPVIIVWGITSGVFTATESGAVAAVYALAIGFLMRSLTAREALRRLVSATSTTIRVIFPVAGAILFGWILAREGFARLVSDLIISVSGGQEWVGALLVMAMLIVLGFPIEGITLLLVFTPILAPLGPALGYDPVHWGLLIVLSLNLAALTPPVGGAIYLCAGMARATIDDTVHYLWPFLFVWVVVVVIVLFVPQTVMWIPNAMMPG